MSIPSARLRRVLSAAAALAIGPAALAQTLTDLPTGCRGSGRMSANGTYVVGHQGSVGGGYLWSAASPAGFLPLGGVDAVAVSSDGSVVLGNITNALGKGEAAIWQSLTGTWSGLGTIPSGGSCDSNFTSGVDLSNDGLVSTGLAWEACQGRAFYNDVSGMIKVPQIGPNSSRGIAVSGDGLFVGGWIQADNGVRRAAIWNMVTGTQVLPTVGPGNAIGSGETLGFSTNGRYAVGQGGGGFQAWRYDRLDGSLQYLGALPGASPSDKHIARAVSDDGKTVVGHSGPNQGMPWRAWIWTEADGMQDLSTWLPAAGMSLSQALYGAYDLSADGRTLLGAYAGTLGPLDGFVVELPPIVDLGGSTPGTGGLHPVLSATGSLAPATSFAFYIDDARPNSYAVLFASTQSNPVPLFFGTFFPLPVVITFPLIPTDGDGEFMHSMPWPNGMPSGVSITMQAVVSDPVAFAGYALTNGMTIVTP